MKKKKVDFNKISEMPDVAIAEGSMLVNKTGSWRYLRPVYREKLAPCRKGCPLGTDIPRVIALITKRQFREAWELVVSTNPLPTVAGHACYHACENSCTRTALDDKIGVQALERFLADRYLEEDFPYRPGTGQERKVAIIGAGPAGLAAAWELRRYGYQAEIFEQSREAGGLLRKAIPPYKLSRKILDRDIDRLQRFGIKLHLNEAIDSIAKLSELKGSFAAIIIATGIEAAPRRYFPGETSPQVYSGLEFLKAVNESQRPEIGTEVVVIGKGNSALDSARSSRRLGAKARVVPLCSRAEMSVSGEEIKAAEAEDIEFLYQADVLAARIESGKLHLELKGLKSISETGEDVPAAADPYIPGSEFTITADTVIEAQGEGSSLKAEIKAFLESDNVFAAGDALSGSSSIAHAMKSGITAARSVLSCFGEAPPEEKAIPAFNLMGMNRECFSRASQVELPAKPIPEGFLDFSELAETISEQDAVYESGRCISCGVCNNCDTCMTFCPDFCIRSTADGYEVDLDYCKGCGICSQECPRDVIDLIQEGS